MNQLCFSPSTLYQAAERPDNWDVPALLRDAGCEIARLDRQRQVLERRLKAAEQTLADVRSALSSLVIAAGPNPEPHDFGQECDCGSCREADLDRLYPSWAGQNPF